MKDILLVEDESSTLMILQEQITQMGYTLDYALNGNEAIDLYKKNKYSLIITDLEMPYMNGKELIIKIKEQNENIPIIVLTTKDDPIDIIDVMKMSVFDYLIKSGHQHELHHKIKRALETAELREMRVAMEKEKYIKIQEQLLWFQWSEGLLKKEKDKTDKSLFKNLYMSFNQGAGLGTVLTLLKMISTTAEKKDDKYIIESDLFDIVNENARIAENVINTFTELNTIITGEIEAEKIPVSDIYTTIVELTETLSVQAELKSQSFLVSDNKEIFKSFYCEVNNGYLKKAIEELLLNAFKFSHKGTSVTVIIDIHEKTFNLSLLNSPEKSEKDIVGIPVEYENIVFEPFFRITKKVFPDYHTLDYGLGLTMVQKIIERFKGSIRISNINDYSDISRDPVQKVVAVISIPVLQK